MIKAFMKLDITLKLIIACLLLLLVIMPTVRWTMGEFTIKIGTNSNPSKYLNKNEVDALRSKCLERGNEFKVIHRTSGKSSRQGYFAICE